MQEIKLDITVNFLTFWKAKSLEKYISFRYLQFAQTVQIVQYFQRLTERASVNITITKPLRHHFEDRLPRNGFQNNSFKQFI